MEEKKLTGYPSIDKPWLKYYSAEAIHTPLPECTMYELLWQNNKDHLDDIALNYYDRKITYGGLFEGIDKAAKAFTAMGVKQGEIVAICSVNTPETVYALYALNRLGAVANMIDPRTNADGVKHYLEECNIRFVMTIELAYPLFVKVEKTYKIEKIISVSAADSLPQPKKFLYRLKNKQPALQENAMTWTEFMALGNGTEVQVIPYQKDRCSVIAHTGGTTGAPKGVMLSDDNMNAIVHSYGFVEIPFKRGNRFFNDLPPFIIYGLSLSTHTALCHGLELIYYPVFDSKAFPKMFAKYKPNYFASLPDHLKFLARDPATRNMNLDFLVIAAAGGDAVSLEVEKSCNEFLRRQKCKYSVTKGYGMTEMCAIATFTTPSANSLGSVGIPLTFNTVKIMDVDTMKELSFNQTGEIWFSSPSIMIGYYNKPEETAEIIATDEMGTRWIRTGDLGHITEDGLLFHEGRIRRIYITSHEGQPAKIFPILVEDHIRKSDAVFDCVVVGRLKENSANYEPVAYVILKNQEAAPETVKKELEVTCRENVPSYMWPVEYRFVDEFPHTPIGKIDFRALEKEAAEMQ